MRPAWVIKQDTEERKKKEKGRETRGRRTWQLQTGVTVAAAVSDNLEAQARSTE